MRRLTLYVNQHGYVLDTMSTDHATSIPFPPTPEGERALEDALLSALRAIRAARHAWLDDPAARVTEDDTP